MFWIGDAIYARRKCSFESNNTGLVYVKHNESKHTVLIPSRQLLYSNNSVRGSKYIQREEKLLVYSDINITPVIFNTLNIFTLLGIVMHCNLNALK